MSETYLHDAASAGDLGRLRVLLAAGNVNVNQGDEHETTALMKAIMEGHAQVFDALITAGADVNARDDCSQTPLHHACFNRYPDFVQKLVSLGADVDAQDIHLNNPLLVACQRRCAEAVAILLEEGAELELPNSQGETPMTYAVDDIGILLEDAINQRQQSRDTQTQHQSGDLPPAAPPARVQHLLMQAERTTQAAEERAQQSQRRLSESIAREAVLMQRVRELEGLNAELQSTLASLRHALAQQEATQQAEAHEPRVYSTMDLNRACGDFSADRILGRGAFGAVYRGTLAKGTEVAVKRANFDSGLVGESNFRQEVRVLTLCLHENVLPLLGVGLGEPWCLVYPFMSNISLDRHLQDAAKKAAMPWDMRVRIALGVANALSYLHTPLGNKPAVVHRDVKAANVLLDSSMNPRLGDAGIARVLDPAATSAATQCHGTFNYLDPAYLDTGLLTEKSDIYSLGVVMVELVVGQLATPGMVNRVRNALLDGVDNVADGSVEWAPGVATKLGGLAHSCCNRDPTERASLQQLVELLEATLNDRPSLLERRERVCMVCLESPAHTRFRPCFHSVVCETDATTIMQRGGRCPICRIPVQAIDRGEFEHTFSGP